MSSSWRGGSTSAWLRLRSNVLALAAGYIGLVIAANVATAHLGLIHAGVITVTAGTFIIGFTFIVRDALDDATGRRRLPILAAITAGAALSAALAPIQLAAASGITFLTAELADMAVFRRLRQRSRLGAWIASNTIAAPIDSALFLWLAGFPIAGWWSQTVVKVAVGALVPLLFAHSLRREVTARDLLRHRLHHTSP